MQVFNSLSKRLEQFLPVDKEKNLVIMYVCGLTPYDSAHIGHARTYVSFDVLKRYLLKKGMSVYHIQNITDVDDKIINRCRETGADPKQLTEVVHAEALELFGRLNITAADVYPKVTNHVGEIIDLIKQLISHGCAYQTDGGVYFKVSAFKNYGALSGQNLNEIKAGARIEVDDKKHDPADFALWKNTDGEIIEFDSPWGRGRPGWHIECSAMARKYAKRTLDIHGGARDLIFPHHENEIAQSEGASRNHEKFSKYWMHTGFLTVGGEKMSKSLGNFITLKQALEKFSPNALRLFYLQAHYRSPLDYDEDNISGMEETVERIFNSLGLVSEVLVSASDSAGSKADKDFRAKSDALISSFYENMENDLNTPEALASLFGLFRLANSNLSEKAPDLIQLKKIHTELSEMLLILGLEIQEKSTGLKGKADAIAKLVLEFGIDGTKAPSPTSAEFGLEALIALRNEARAKKNYKLSDEIRNRLAAIGIQLEDKQGISKGNARWKLIK